MESDSTVDTSDLLCVNCDGKIYLASDSERSVYYHDETRSRMCKSVPKLAEPKRIEATYRAKWLKACDAPDYIRAAEMANVVSEMDTEIERLRERVAELQGDVKLWKDKWSHATK